MASPLFFEVRNARLSGQVRALLSGQYEPKVSERTGYVVNATQITVGGQHYPLTGGGALAAGAVVQVKNITRPAAAVYMPVYGGGSITTVTTGGSSSTGGGSSAGSDHTALTLGTGAAAIFYLAVQYLELSTQTAAQVLAGPATGAAAMPTFRALAATDIPALAAYILDPATPEQGDVLYWSGSAWVRLAHGTAGQYLKSGGHAANPAWENMPSGGAVDAGDVSYTPAVAADWDGSADPGDVDNALDQLAARLGDVEGSAVHAAVTLGVDAGAVLDLTDQEITLDTQTANMVFAGPTSGIAATPIFRVLVAADLPEMVPPALKIYINQNFR